MYWAKNVRQPKIGKKTDDDIHEPNLCVSELKSNNNDFLAFGYNRIVYDEKYTAPQKCLYSMMICSTILWIWSFWLFISFSVFETMNWSIFYTAKWMSEQKQCSSVFVVFVQSNHTVMIVDCLYLSICIYRYMSLW